MRPTASSSTKKSKSGSTTGLQRSVSAGSSLSTRPTKIPAPNSRPKPPATARQNRPASARAPAAPPSVSNLKSRPQTAGAKPTTKKVNPPANRPFIGGRAPTSRPGFLHDPYKPTTSTKPKPKAPFSKTKPPVGKIKPTLESKPKITNRPVTTTKTGVTAKRPATSVKPTTQKEKSKLTKPGYQPVKHKPVSKPAPISRPASAKTIAAGIPARDSPKKTVPEPAVKTPKKPVGKPNRLSMDPSKRRRTRFSMNKIELEKQLTEWVDTEKTKKAGQSSSENVSQIWTDLAKSDTVNNQEHIMLKTVDGMIQELFDMHLPHMEVWDALEDLREGFPNVDIQLFACYWKAKATVAINVGKSQTEVMEIIETGQSKNAQPAGILETFKIELGQKYAEQPSLISGKPEDDPEMTIALPEDEELELSIVFSPPFKNEQKTPEPENGEKTEIEDEPGDQTVEPSLMSPMIDQYTKGTNASFFRLMVSHKV